METIRKTKKYELNEGHGMSRGLYNVSDRNDNLSFWFDIRTKNELLKLDDKSFEKECKKLIDQSNY